MKKFLFLILLFSSCLSVTQVGQFTVVSTRNFESKANYILLKSYAGATKRELRKTKASSLDQAINNTVKSVPNGEFMKNVKVYLVHRGKKVFFAVEGDVWGNDTLVTK